MRLINKHINKIKLSITTSCNLNCNYCFVIKNDERMSLQTAKRAVNLLLSSHGKDKLLSIYGGEPWLNFGLIEKIVPYAIARAKEMAKALTITICTNATLLKREHLLFLKKYNIRIIISMVGKKLFHDRVRRFNSMSGTYDIIKNKLSLLYDIMPEENIGLSFCIFPSTVDNIKENFLHLISLGFKYINLEIIREYEPWTAAKIDKFGFLLRKIVRYIFSEIYKKNFIFLNPINWEIKYQMLTESLNVNCPFNYKLEIYPKGEIGFSPFLLNSRQKQNYIIGNINKLTLQRFSDCQFNPKSIRCSRCEYDYFRRYPFDVGASQAYKLYHLICLKAAKDIQECAHKIKPFKDYIQKIKEKMCF